MVQGTQHRREIAPPAAANGGRVMGIDWWHVARGPAAPRRLSGPWGLRAPSRAQWLTLACLMGVVVYATYSWSAAAKGAWRGLDRASAWAATLAQRQIERSCEGFDLLDARLAAAHVAPGGQGAESGPTLVLDEIAPGLEGMRRVAVLDPAGRVVAAAGDGWPEGVVDMRTLGLLHAYVTRPGVAPARHCAAELVAGVPAGLSLYAEHDQRSAVAGRRPWSVVARIDLRELSSWWAGLGEETFGRHGLRLGLLDARGNLVLGLPAPAPRPLRARAPERSLRGSVPEGRAPGGTVWTVRHGLRGLPFAVYASVERSAVLDAWWSDARFVVLGGLGLAGLPGGLGLLGWARRRRELAASRRRSPRTAVQPGRRSPALPVGDVSPEDCTQALARIDLRLLETAPGGLPETAQTISDILASVLGARVVLVAHVGASATWAGILACAGPGRAGSRGFRISRREDLVEGQGPSGTALRTGQLQQWHVDEPRCEGKSGWLRGMGAQGVVAAPARTSDGEHVLLLVAYEASRSPSQGCLDALAQVAERLARHLERHAVDARATRLSHYRHAWMAMQPQLADVHGRAQALRIVADSLIASTDVVALEMFVPGGAGAMLGLHIPGRADAPAARAVAMAARRDGAAQLQARAWSSGQAQLVYRPCDDADMPEHWRTGPLARAGVLAALPVALAGATSGFGVLRLVAGDPAPWDAAMHEGMRQILQTLAVALERASLFEQVQWLGSHDALTGLHARGALLGCMRRALASTGDDGRGLVLCVLDLHGFHQVNARWGRAMGDSLLHAFGARLQASMPQALSVARVGADEFALLFHGGGLDEQAAAVVQRVEQALRAPRAGVADGARETERIGFCLGLTRAPQDHGTAEELLEHAYAAVQTAKFQRLLDGADWAAWSPRSGA